MSRNKRLNGKKNFAVGAFFGGIVGGLTALLLAPKSGEKMRKDLTKKYQDMFDDVCEQTSELVEKAKDIALTAKEAAAKIYRRD